MKKIAGVIALSALLLVQAVSAQTLQTEKNKKSAVAFLQRLFGDHDFSAIDQYLSDTYIQHNPDVADGKEALRKAATKWLANAPKIKLAVLRVAADGDLVFIHTKTKGTQGKDVSLVDIFRFKNNRIIEHWDVREQVPEKSVNPHPLF